MPTTWKIVGTGDFNGDGKTDILWRDEAGNVAVWFLNSGGSGTIASTGFVGGAPATWTVAGTGDFNFDGKSDILWRDTAGNVAIWFFSPAGAGTITSTSFVGGIPPSFSISGTGDFNADGKSDILPAVRSRSG